MAHVEPPINEAPGARSYRQIKAWISDGTLKPGDHLLPEQALSERLGVARTTIRTTLSRLEDEGLVRLTGRKRTVLPPVVGAQGSVRNSVVLLGHPSGVTNARARLPGWSDFIAMGATEALHRTGRFVLNLPASTPGPSFAQVLAERPRGVLVCDPHPGMAPLLSLVSAAGVPCVCYGNRQDPGLAAFHTVVSDHAAGQQALTNALIEKGRQRILRCWVINQRQTYPTWLSQRDQGYLAAVTAAHLKPLDPLLLPVIEGPVDSDGFLHNARTFAGYLAPHLLGPHPVDGLMAISDGTVPYLAAALRILGKDPEAGLPITGYDHYWADIRELRWEACPPIATVDKNNGSLGAEMVRVLDALVDGSLAGEPQEHVVPHSVIAPVADMEALRRV